MDKDEALKLALKALRFARDDGYENEVSQQAITAIKQALAAPVQDLPFGVGGGLVAIKTLLSRDPCVHANTAIEMIDAILKEHPAAQPAPVREDWGPGPHEYHSLPSQPAPVQPMAHIVGEIDHTGKVWKPVQPAPVQATMKLESSGPGHGPAPKQKLSVRHVSLIDEGKTAAQPAVPDAIIEAGESPDYRDGWNDCRQTMLEILKARTA